MRQEKVVKYLLHSSHHHENGSKSHCCCKCRELSNHLHKIYVLTMMLITPKKTQNTDKFYDFTTSNDSILTKSLNENLN